MEDQLRMYRPGNARKEQALINFLFVLYCLGGFAIAFMFADDLDPAKEILIGLVGFPLGVFYFSSFVLFRGWRQKKPGLYRASAVLLILCFSIGYVTLTNVLSTTSYESIKRQMMVKGNLRMVEVYRGGLGMLYRFRF